MAMSKANKGNIKKRGGSLYNLARNLLYRWLIVEMLPYNSQ